MLTRPQELAEALKTRFEGEQSNQRIGHLLDTLHDLLDIVTFFDMYLDGQHEMGLMVSSAFLFVLLPLSLSPSVPFSVCTYFCWACLTK